MSNHRARHQFFVSKFGTEIRPSMNTCDAIDKDNVVDGLLKIFERGVCECVNGTSVQGRQISQY